MNQLVNKDMSFVGKVMVLFTLLFLGVYAQRVNVNQLISEKINNKHIVVKSVSHNKL